jgi:hypothetical protein
MTAQTKTHLVIATPCYGGQLTGAYFFSLLKLQEACMSRGIGLTVLTDGNDALITRARQDLVSQFLEMPDTTHLLFVDADIEFEPEQVFRLLQFDADMTAAAYPLKRYDWPLVKALAINGSDRLETANLHYVFGLASPGTKRNGFGKALHVGTGFLMIRRKALTAMMERYPELRYSGVSRAEDPMAGSTLRSALFNCMLDEKGGQYLSEDYSFCKRWTDMGGEIWVDMKSRLGHVGHVTFQGDVDAQGRVSTNPHPRKPAP